jgi:alanine racemase
MVLNPRTLSFSAIIQHKLEPEIYCLKGLAWTCKTKKNCTSFLFI